MGCLLSPLRKFVYGVEQCVSSQVTNPCYLWLLYYGFCLLVCITRVGSSYIKGTGIAKVSSLIDACNLFVTVSEL